MNESSGVKLFCIYNSTCTKLSRDVKIFIEDLSRSEMAYQGAYSVDVSMLGYVVQFADDPTRGHVFCCYVQDESSRKAALFHTFEVIATSAADQRIVELLAKQSLTSFSIDVYRTARGRVWHPANTPRNASLRTYSKNKFPPC